MTGWLALMRVDGSSVDEREAGDMLAALRVRAPHGDALVVDGEVALGQAHLDTGGAAPPARGPVRYGPWLAVGQVRIDARTDVAAALGLEPRTAAEITDLELLVRALDRHGDDVITRVGGEYSWCAWHSRERRLLLGRDGFGVRQLFWARAGELFIASNSLLLVRDHPAVSGDLDEDALLDFLCFEATMDATATPFRDVRRLPAAHLMEVTREGASARRVWRLEAPEVDRRLSIADHAAAFRTSLMAATAERLGERTSILLSGGIDSPGMAVCAAASCAPASCSCVTEGSNDPADREPALARSVAARLGLPWRLAPVTRGAGEPLGATGPMLRTEPWNAPTTGEAPVAQLVAAHGTVALHGEGGDEIWRYPPVVELARALPAATLLAGLVSTARRGLRPALGTGLLALLRVGRIGQPRTRPPSWIARGMQGRAAARCALGDDAYLRLPDMGERSIAVARLTNPLWPGVFLAADADTLGEAVELRFPYLDRRVVDAALRTPSLPGAVGKHVTRLAFADSLPRAVLARGKNGTMEALLPALRSERPWRRLAGPVAQAWRGPVLGRFVDVEAAVRSLESATDDVELQDHLRALSLARWIAGLERTPS